MWCEGIYGQRRRPVNYLVDWRYCDFTAGSQRMQEGGQIWWKSASSIWRPPECLNRNPLRILTDLWNWAFISRLRHWPIHFLIKWWGSCVQNWKVDLDAGLWIRCEVDFKFRHENWYMAEFWWKRGISSSFWPTVLRWVVIQSEYHSSIRW